MGEPKIEQLGKNFYSVHAHGPAPDGSQDGMSADFLAALRGATNGFFDIDGVHLNFMGGMVPQKEVDHDGIKGQDAVDALVVRKRG